MSILKNAIKICKLIFIINRKYLFLSFTYIMLCILQPFLLLFFIEYFVDGILSKNQSVEWLYLSGLFLFLHIGGACGKVILDNFVKLNQKAMMIDMSALFCKKAADMDYEGTENQEILGEMDRASYVLVFGNSWETYLDAINVSLISLGEFIFCLFLVSQIPFYFVIAIILLSLANIIYGLYVQNENYELYKNEMPLERRWKYFNQLACDVEYGKTMRIFQLQDYIRQRGKENRQEYITIHKQIIKKDGRKELAQNSSNVIIEIGIMAVLAYEVIKKSITIGKFTVILNAAKQLAGSMTLLFDGIVNLYRNDKYINDFFTFLERPSLLRSQKYGMTEKDYKLTTTSGRIEFKNVTFVYPGTDHAILQDINIVIEPGEHLMLVGENGAGKTTLIKLLMRLYDVTKGEILYNGINIKEYDYDVYMKNFSTVFQDFHILDVSVYENIMFMDANNMRKREKVDKLLKDADLWDRIENMSEKGETVLTRRFESEGTDLSLGQQQMLAFVRAVYKNGGTVIMDEPTASLSSLAESNLYKQFQNLVGNKTALFVSHRLSSSSICDKICVLKEGKIEEYGTQTELMKKNGTYAEMYKLQAQYYI